MQDFANCSKKVKKITLCVKKYPNSIHASLTADGPLIAFGTYPGYFAKMGCFGAYFTQKTV